MNSRLNPYLSFQNNAKEAMEFYKDIFGGTLEMTTFKDANIPGMVGTDQENLIMHAALETPNGLLFMASDTPSHIPFQDGSRISMSLSGDNETELTSYWEKLSVGGTITQPLQKAPWGDMFGMVKDKFGILWMVNIINGQ